MDRNQKKRLILKYEGLLSRIYRFFGHNKVRVAKRNTLDLGHAFMKSCHISISGLGNEVIFEPGLTRLKGSNICVSGNNCRVVVGGGVI